MAIFEVFGGGLTGWLVPLLVILVLYNWMRRSPLKLPPGPLSFPLIGSLPFMTGDIRKVFKAMAEKYGDIFTVYMGTERIVVINGYQTIRTCLLKSGGVFDDRPTKAFWEDLTGLRGIVSSNGEAWKQHRRYVLHLLKELGLGKRTTENIITEEICHLSNALKEFKGAPCRLQKSLDNMSSNVICSVAFGARFEYDDPEFKNYLSRMTEVMSYSGPDNLAVIFVQLRRLPGDLFNYHKMLGARNKLDVIFLRWIDQQKQRIAAGEIPTDVIGQYLQEMERRSDETNTFSEDELLQVVGDLFLAGSDTTATTLSWAFLYMIINPHIQTKVQAEIDEVVGLGRVPGWADRSQMPYTESVLSEVQRICDLVPITPHATREDAHIKGFVIPKGTMVLMNYSSVMFDPQLWSNPEEFYPDRFLNESGQYQKREEVVNFSLGKRSCLGEGLARMELFIVFTNLLHQFTFTKCPGTNPTSEGIMGLTRHPKPYDVIVHPRHQ